MAFGRRSFRGRSRYGRNRPAQGQGRMKAEFSGAVGLIRHSVNVTGSAFGIDEVTDGKATAYPLISYFGTSGNSPTAGESIQPYTAEGSRVNHVSINLSITQADTTKPNQVYVGLISTSFSDAALDATNMTDQFADLIAMYNSTTGTMTAFTGLQDLTFNEWSLSARKRHWIRGFSRNTYTLYSGRPAILNTVLRVPGKNKRQQFGSGFWLVVMNDSGEIQGEDSGSGTAVNVSLKTFFKEIPQLPIPVT
ncbi:MAG TPA: hypothetical protein EYN67_11590 [Flavobacteriales bacterium]|nr:hypothetical protein [Flavobacteriales bacterium]